MENIWANLLAAVIGALTALGVHWLQGRRGAKAAKAAESTAAWAKNDSEHKRLESKIDDVKFMVGQMQGSLNTLLALMANPVGQVLRGGQGGPSEPTGRRRLTAGNASNSGVGHSSRATDRPSRSSR